MNVGNNLTELEPIQQSIPIDASMDLELQDSAGKSVAKKEKPKELTTWETVKAVGLSE